MGFRAYALRYLASLARLRGDAARARWAVRELLPAGTATAPGEVPYYEWVAPVQAVAAALALDRGDLPAARAWLDAHGRWLAWSGAVPGRSEGEALWARYHRRAGDANRAREHAARALARATVPRQPLALLAAHRLLGELASDVGRHDEARQHLDAALALAAACAAPYERALTLLALAELRRAGGDRAGGRAALDEARAALEPLGARPALARAAALATRLAAPPTPAPPFGLSAREVEVLRLVAQGLTDAQVAARLARSPHTIHGHLRAVYSKLGVASRTAATRVALAHGLGDPPAD